jgi:hypothetical protein
VDSSVGAIPRRPAAGIDLDLGATLLLSGLAAGLLGQGAYAGWMQCWVGLLIGAAALLAFARPGPATAPRHGPRLAAAALAAGVLAAWMVIGGAAHGAVLAGSRSALLLTGFVTVLVTCRRLSDQGREVVLDGVTVVGLLVAGTGWLGVTMHHSPWGMVAQGLWRASSAITYPNATAAALVPLALVTVARLTGRPRSPALGLAATGLFTGIAATGSRAGAGTIAAGLIVLAVLLGWRAVGWALLGPVLGAGVALLGMLPSVPVAATARPALAGVALLCGCGLSVAVPRTSRAVALATASAAALAVPLAIALAPAGQLWTAARTVAAARLTVASPGRLAAVRPAVRAIAASPFTGLGPGRPLLLRTGPTGLVGTIRYVHNEYLQTAVDFGLVGAVLFTVFAGALGRTLWPPPGVGPGREVWAGVVAGIAALAAHSAVDFIWHVAAIPLVAAALIGVAAPGPGRPGLPFRNPTTSNEELP